MVTIAAFVVMLKDIFLFNVCTLPKYRRKGLAKLALRVMQKHGIEKYKTQGIKGNVDDKNKIAINFYEKYGAKIDKDFSLCGGGSQKTSFRMFIRWKNNEKELEKITKIIRKLKENVENNCSFAKEKMKYGIFAIWFITCAIFVVKKRKVGALKS